ncbi:hypothetical protein Dimus_025661 [Dionaea muscipula]
MPIGFTGHSPKLGRCGCFAQWRINPAPLDDDLPGGPHRRWWCSCCSEISLTKLVWAKGRCARWPHVMRTGYASLCYSRGPLATPPSAAREGHWSRLPRLPARATGHSSLCCPRGPLVGAPSAAREGQWPQHTATRTGGRMPVGVTGHSPKLGRCGCSTQWRINPTPLDDDLPGGPHRRWWCSCYSEINLTKSVKAEGLISSGDDLGGDSTR